MAGSVKVLAFAGAKDVIGTGELELALDELFDSGAARTTRGLMDAMCEKFPALEAHRPIIRIAVNGSYAGDDDLIAAGDEVALIPPVAGG